MQRNTNKWPFILKIRRRYFLNRWLNSGFKILFYLYRVSTLHLIAAILKIKPMPCNHVAPLVPGRRQHRQPNLLSDCLDLSSNKRGGGGSTLSNLSFLEFWIVCRSVSKLTHDWWHTTSSGPTCGRAGPREQVLIKIVSASVVDRSLSSSCREVKHSLR